MNYHLIRLFLFFIFVFPNGNILFSQSVKPNEFLDYALKLDSITSFSSRHLRSPNNKFSDKTFYSFLKEGVQFEISNEYFLAQKSYLKAGRLIRAEKSTDEIYFSKARLLIREGKIKKAISFYSKFLNWAQFAINHWEKTNYNGKTFSYNLEEIKLINLKMQLVEKIINYYN